MTVVLWGALIVAGALSWMLTGLVRRYALARAILDMPGPRSSHERPTPRGGGLAIAVVVLGGTTAAYFAGLLPGSWTTGIVGGGIIVGAAGWLDDRLDLPPLPRMVAQTTAAVWFMVCINGIASVSVGSTEVNTGIAGNIAAVVFIVWMTNLYNFMDGLDGFAASEAVSVGVIGGCLLLLTGASSLALVALLIAAAAFGFMIWNWAPASIFMGDVGSGLLGFLFAALALVSETTNAVPLLTWLLLLGWFILDATITLLRRIARREKWLSAHRLHAYQLAADITRSHSTVSTGLILLNIVLGILAFLTLKQPGLLVVMTVSGIAAVAALYVLIEARRPMRRPGETRDIGA